MYQLISSGNINRLDTPYFSSIDEQNIYFTQRIVHSYEGYFPPYYTNTVRLSLSEFNIFNSAVVDYLRLQWNNKWYYYFIDNKMYLNEDIVELSITMDVIQTFMFNYTITGGTVTRQSIKRWNGDVINRQYIRENLSQGAFHIVNYEEFDKPVTTNALTSGDEISWYILITTEPLTTFATFTRVDDVISSLYYYLVPSSNGILTYSGKQLVNVQNTSQTKLLSQPSVYKMFAITNNSVVDYFNLVFENGILKSFRGQTLNVSAYSPNNAYSIIFINEYTPYEIDEEKNFTAVYDIMPLLFKKNTTPKTSFQNYYCPVMLDTNYVHIEFGEKMQYTTFPLELGGFKLINNQISMYGVFKYDMQTNTRSYYITDNKLNNKEYLDYYNTTIQNSSLEEFEIVNDYWLQYQAQHKGDLTTGIALARFNNGYSALSSAITGLATVGSGVATGNVGKQITGATQGIMSLPNFAVGVYNINQNLQITKENMESTPNTVKQGNNMQSDKHTNSYVTMTRAFFVQDFDAVAKKYELFGYRTNETIYTTVSVSDYFYRQYWNIVAIDNAIIKASSSLISETEKALIKERLSSGIRFINVSDMTLSDTLDYNFKYDNIEK